MGDYLGKAESARTFISLALEFSDVCEILRASDRAFVLDEVLLAQDEERDAIDLGCDFAGEGILVGYTGETGQQVDAVRRAAELNDLVAFIEINRREFRIGEAEFS